MRISKVMAVTAAGCALAAAAALPAAGASHGAVASTKQFKSTLTPSTVKVGQTMTLKGHGALKNTGYDCVVVVIKGTAYGLDSASIKPVTSTKTGAVTCAQKFTAFSASVGGKTRHCPLTKADKKAKFRCGVAVSTPTKTSATIAYFTAKK
jgi:hypothetical protein